MDSTVFAAHQWAPRERVLSFGTRLAGEQDITFMRTKATRTGPRNYRLVADLVIPGEELDDWRYTGPQTFLEWLHCKKDDMVAFLEAFVAGEEAHG